MNAPMIFGAASPAELPAEVYAAAWTRCTWCQVVRKVPKRDFGYLKCPTCGVVRDHKAETPGRWNIKTHWLAKVFRAAGFTVNTSATLGTLNSGKPVAVKVTCYSLEDPPSLWQDSTPVAVAVTLNRDLTPWGLADALQKAWNHLGHLDLWHPLEWDNPARLGWSLGGTPGDVDPKHRVPADYLPTLFGLTKKEAGTP